MHQPAPNHPFANPAPTWAAPARAILIVLAIPLAARFAAAPTAGGEPPAHWPALTVDANAAPVAVLEALPGLGPALAGRIVAARPFRSLDDLDRRVKGIGPARVAGLRPFLQFPDPPRD